MKVHEFVVSVTVEGKVTGWRVKAALQRAIDSMQMDNERVQVTELPRIIRSLRYRSAKLSLLEKNFPDQLAQMESLDGPIEQ